MKATSKTARRRAIDRQRERLEARRNQSDDALGLKMKQNQRGNMVITWTIDPDPMVALMALAELHPMLQRVERELVGAGRYLGIAWDELAWAIGLTRGALQKRHPHVDDDVDKIDPAAPNDETSTP